MGMRDPNIVSDPDGSRRQEESGMFSRPGVQTTERPSERAQDTAKEIEEQVQDVVDAVEERAKEAMDLASDTAKSALEKQKNRLAGGIQDVARVMHDMGGQMRNQDQGAVADYMDQAAKQLERFSGTVRAKGVDEMVQDAENFARKQPEIFIGGAFFLGLVAARFLKSSSQVSQEMANRQQRYEL